MISTNILPIGLNMNFLNINHKIFLLLPFFTESTKILIVGGYLIPEYVRTAEIVDLYSSSTLCTSIPMIPKDLLPGSYVEC
jgi:hypothetical protein